MTLTQSENYIIENGVLGVLGHHQPNYRLKGKIRIKYSDIGEGIRIQ
jgi:hypothetical protein